jgi:uncharacterized protein YndB with AHSA1/START domain
MKAEGTEIIAEFEVGRPPDRAWRALTEPDLLATWLMENDFKPIVGHRFTFRAQPLQGWDGVVHGEVLVVEAPRRLSYAWRSMPDKRRGDPYRLDTVVTWTLTPTANGGTRVRMEHSGFEAHNAFAFQGLTNGWNGKVLPALKERIAALG